MGLFSKLFHEFVDVIEWVDDSSNTMVYRFERYGNEIKYGARLIVREAQFAVFVNEGQVADVLGPGTYELETRNLPILTTLQNWHHGFQSPFKAEVYFCNARRFTDMKWGTKQPLMLRDSEFGGLRIRAFGTYGVRITDALRFIREIVGTDGVFTTDEISAQLRNLITSRFATIIGGAGIPVLDMAANYDQLGEFLTRRIAPEFGEYGLELTRILVENISLPPAVSEALDKRTSMGITGNLDRYLQYQTGVAMEAAAGNPGGGASDGIGMGIGLAMANRMNESLAPGAHPSPPPIPGDVPLAFHLVADGAAHGPFTVEAMKQQAASGRLQEDTLVWSPQMSQWEAAGTVEALAGIWSKSSVSPPPIPGS
ncbi:MAG: SPFH domain-containing protein [Granulosicoccus sp.]|nr:SPFH domain-containing protein [Granulosicoccus sp.]